MPARKKKILIAPLDWGLGHATRCIPIIRYCIEAGHEPMIICTGRSLALLKNEFPSVQYIDVPGYNIYYQERGSFIGKIIVQLPKVFSGIRKEHHALQKIAAEIKPDLIISDNRYGMWSRKIRSIFISHQLVVKIPGASFVEYCVYKWQQWQSRHFDAIWVPDVAGEINLSGDLSHKYAAGKKITFIGILTRFKKPAVLPAAENKILVIVSGPEPQRTIFEEKIMEQAKKLPYQFSVIQGKSESAEEIKVQENITLISHVPAEKMFGCILQSEIIISRGGYSTLMDLAPLGKKCIFIPTPGQTEQEYLVGELARKGLVTAGNQNDFDLQQLIADAQTTKGFFIDVKEDDFIPFLEKELNAQ